MMTLILLIVVLLIVFGGGAGVYSYRSTGNYMPGPQNLIGILIFILVIVLIIHLVGGIGLWRGGI